MGPGAVASLVLCSVDCGLNWHLWVGLGPYQLWSYWQENEFQVPKETFIHDISKSAFCLSWPQEPQQMQPFSKPSLPGTRLCPVLAYRSPWYHQSTTCSHQISAQDLWCSFFSFIFNCFSIRVVPIFPPLLCPALPNPISYIQSTCLPLTLFMGPLYMFFDLIFPCLSHIIPLPPSHRSLSIWSLFPCLCFYFDCLFALLIRFHIQVRS